MGSKAELPAEPEFCLSDNMFGAKGKVVRILRRGHGWGQKQKVNPITVAVCTREDESRYSKKSVHCYA